MAIGGALANNDDYVRQKLIIGLALLNRGRDSLGKRVRRAWEEMSALDPEDFKNENARRDYEHLQSLRELYVIEGQTPRLSDAQLEDVRERMHRLYAAVVR